MKILLSADAYATTLTNGVTVVLKTLYDTYTSQGHEVRILTMSKARDAHHEGDVYYLPSFNTPLYPDVRLSFVRHHAYLDELREWKGHIQTRLAPEAVLALRAELTAIADRIGAEHERQVADAF